MLYIVATPIGNLDDLSRRAVEVLRSADIIACEDTRRTRILLDRFEIVKPGRMVSYREQTEMRESERLLVSLKRGATVVLCSDGGYPGISDPGYRLICAAAEHGVELCVIPGASAVPVALLSSGLPSSSYVFKGYPPKKEGARLRFFEEEKDGAHTLVIFESPLRVVKALNSALSVFGNRKAAVCIELTKKFERVSRGFLVELIKEFEDQKIKGEVTIVIVGNNPKFILSTDAIAEES